MSLNLNDLPNNEAVFICGHIFRNERRIAYVVHDLDGALSMLCGEEDCDVENSENCKLVGLIHMINYDNSLKLLTIFPKGHEAWHKPDDDWILTPIAKEDKDT